MHFERRYFIVEYQLDVRGSVHHSTIHKEKNQTGRNNVTKFYYFIFI